MTSSAPGRKTRGSDRTSKEGTTIPRLDVEKVRRDFPVLGHEMNGHPLVYLDNAASVQKPQVVIDSLRRFYESEYSNIHRGVYRLSEQATLTFEEARQKVQRFLGAEHPEEIIFTRGTTESINLVAATFGEVQVGAGDEVLITEMEHHSNIVPWYMLCQRSGAELKVAPFDDTGTLDLDAYDALLTERTKLVAVTHISNALGTINPIKEMIRLAHAKNIPVLVDGAQSVQHQRINVRELDCDFFAFSGHKVFGPSGIGALYGKAKHLRSMPPYQGGGGMIGVVTHSHVTYAEPPARFEAGTPNIGGAIALGAALDYVDGVGFTGIEHHMARLTDYAVETLNGIPGLRLIGTAKERTGILSFTLPGIHPHDLGTILDSRGIAIRVGHHCAQPIMNHFDVPATARASLTFYNTEQEIDALALGLRRALEMFEACPISKTFTKK